MENIFLNFFLIFGSLKKGNRPFLFIFLLAEHHGYAKSIYQQNIQSIGLVGVYKMTIGVYKMTT